MITAARPAARLQGALTTTPRGGASKVTAAIRLLPTAILTLLASRGGQEAGASSWSGNGHPTSAVAGDCESQPPKIVQVMHNAETFKYLPTASQLLERSSKGSTGGACSGHLDRRLRDLWDHLTAVQSNAHATAIVHKIKGGGLGSVTTYAAFRFSHVLSSAFSEGRGGRAWSRAAPTGTGGHPLVLFNWTGGLHKYTDHSLRSSFCPGKEDSLDCYFASPAKTTHTQRVLNHKDRSRPVPPFMVPAKYADIGLFWYHAQLLRFLLQPNEKMAAAISEVKAALQWPVAGTPVLGMHIRRGDSCMDFYESKKGNHHRTCVGIEAYLHWAEHMQREYGAKHVFVATDSPSFLRQVQAWEGFQVMSISMPRVETHKRGFWGFTRKRDAGEKQQQSSTSYHVTDAAQSAVIDLLLLADTDMFIGTMTSSLSRNAYELMCARAGHLLPFISLDSAWCVSWGKDIPVVYHDGMGGSLTRHDVLC